MIKKQAVSYTILLFSAMVLTLSSAVLDLERVWAAPPPPAPPSSVVLPNTTITSATDGIGQPVQSGGSTFFRSITFHVTATQGTYPIAGFQCSLDGKAFEPCAVTDQGVITENNLEPGQHTFTVRAVDTQGNVDLTPATFIWIIINTGPNTGPSQPPNQTTITSENNGNVENNGNIYGCLLVCGLKVG